MPNRIPASGERAAVIGYSAQYRIAAELIYDELLAGKLEWIGLADPEAGRLDDIQIATIGRLDAFQVKWGEQPNSLSFNQLVEGDGDPDQTSVGLIGQLAGGWRRLRALNPSHHVVAHLIIRGYCAPQANIPNSSGSISPKNLEGFITDCWSERDWVNLGFSAIPAGWEPAISQLHDASGLSESDFLAFICDCEFSFQLDHISPPPGRDGERRQQDIDSLAALLHRTVGLDHRVIRLGRDELLARVNWEDRFKPRFQHDFPIDRCYRPITETVEELEEALSRHNRGYLAVLGTPGSGKSTTLTHTLRYRQGCHLVRYYAFVPDSPFQGRGEAASFLHDLVLALQSQGIRGGPSQAKTNEELLVRLSEQFAELHTRWLEDGIQTLILVDGLDHIEREQSPTRSLVLDFPLPHSVPEGVIFILGSQTLELKGLSPSIKSQLREDSRTLKMNPLSHAATFSIILDAELLTPLTSEQRMSVYQLSDGHPLALSYLLQQLGTAENSLSIRAVLEQSNPYEGHIERTYEVYWQSIEQDTSLRKLLALLCRLRVPFDPRKLAAWADEATINLLVRRAQMFFKTEIASHWRFFHNSFRQFLIERTSQDLLGETSRDRHRDYHSQLANLLSTNPQEATHTWEVLYHLACAEKWAEVSSSATQEFFRQQFYSHRKLRGILEDIELAVRAARAQGDAVAFFRLLLIEQELRERQDAMDQIDMPELLLNVYGIPTALNHAIAGNQLQIARGDALALCATLIGLNEINAARILFNAAEPLDWLNGVVPLHDHDLNFDTLSQWASCAFHFRQLETVIENIESISVKSRQPSQQPIHETSQVQAYVREALIDAISQRPDAALWAQFRTLSPSIPGGAGLARRLDFNICQRHEEHEAAQSALERILSWATHEDASNSNKVLIAEFLINIRGDTEAASKWIKNIGQPSTYSWSGSESWARLAPFGKRIRFNRLLSTLSRPVDPIEAVPKTDDPNKDGHVLFERQLVILAILWGKANRGEMLSAPEIIRTIQPNLRFYYRDWNETEDWRGWYEIRGAQGYYFDFLIRAVAAHGPVAVRALSDEIDRQWSLTKTSKYWLSGIRLRIAVGLYRQDGDRDRLVIRLASIEQEIDVWHDLNDRLDELAELAKAWRNIGETERAQALIQRLSKGSFGVNHEKDNQLQRWVSLLTTAGANQPNLIEEDIPRFASAIRFLEQSGRGRSTQDAAIELLVLAMKINPADAWSLFDWLIGESGLQFSDGVAGLLSGALNLDRPPFDAISIVVRHLYIPFTPTPYKPLAIQLAARAAELLPPPEAEHFLAEINQAIQIKSWPGDRADWWQSMVKGLRQAPEASTYISSLLARESDDKKHSGPFLVLEDGSELTEEESSVLASSFRKLVELIESVKKAEYFAWDRLLEPLVFDMSISEVRRVVILLEPLDIKPKPYYQLGSRLHQLGSAEEALAVIEPLLAASSPAGWDKWYDGGSRFYAFKALIDIDPVKWRPCALECLIDDYLEEYHYPVSMLRMLEELTTILFPVVPWDRLWPEIREHVFQLAEFTKSADQPSIKADTGATVEEVLLRVINWTAERPINELRGATHKALFEFITKPLLTDETKKVVSHWLDRHGMPCLQGLALLDSLKQQEIKFVREFKSKILNLCQSPDYTIRHMAVSLAKYLDLPDDDFSPPPIDLPPIYRFELPRLRTRDAAIPRDAIHAGESFPDSSDALEMVAPFEPELIWLSSVTDIPFENILERTVLLMDSLPSVAQWSRSAEENMRVWHGAIGIKLTYNRPRPAAAQQAISHVIAELVDAGMLDANQLKSAYDKIYLYEPLLANLEPSKQPGLLESPEKPKDLYYRDDWVDHTDEIFEYFGKKLESDFIVLGELSRFIEWDWKLPTEERFSMACHPDWAASIRGTDPHEFFPYFSSWQAMDYPILDRSELIPALLVFGQPRQALIGVTKWLAFNPAVAQSLGWRLVDKGIFRWVNKHDQIMVESCWWQNGPIERLPPRASEITGEGWVVKATPVAVSILMERFGDIAMLQLAKRSFKEKGRTMLETHSMRNRAWSVS